MAPGGLMFPWRSHILRSVFTLRLVPLATVFVCLLLTPPLRAADPLATLEREGRPKAAILEFVARVTKAGDRVCSEVERIAVFDNDGTLWCEQPVYVQLASLDRTRSPGVFITRIGKTGTAPERC